MRRILYILIFAVSAAIAVTGCAKGLRWLPFDVPRFVSSNAQTVTCVPDGRTGYSITEVRFSICDLSTEKGEQVEYGQVEFNAGDNCWENSWVRVWREGRNIKVSFSENTSETWTREITIVYAPDDTDFDPFQTINIIQLPQGMTEEEYHEWYDSL